MKRRRWLIYAAILLAIVGTLDTGAWLFATGALRRAVDQWDAQQRANGTEIAIDQMRRGGWPFAATLAYDVRLGPAGLPGAITVQAGLVSELSPLHARIVRTRIAGARIAAADGAADGAAVVATAPTWWIDVDLDEPHRADMAARDLRLAWRGHAATVASLSIQAAASQGEAGSTRITLRADDVGLAESGLMLPVGFGPVVRSVGFLGTVRGGLPRAEATAEASARAWRQGGGGITIERLSLAYGVLTASVSGAVGLDEALRPAGTGEAEIGGLLPLLAALGAGGVVPAHAAQAAGGVLALLGGGSGEGESGAVRLAIALVDGRVTVAGFPIARLPHLPWQIPVAPPEPGQPQQGH